ncbi:recombinase family protein [Ruminiclostridium herbifermentans]|uniref:Recombinase family protein n=1 Tax=Ruminiclostridium herbifermentans TaxID=2488810 RepID=A0A7H1VMB2_9FIRM|nr:recombinase family protein [Ruminiclostridium herbifermentans]QNU66524.1 recombinase family protein [Ruminiclostridium herbifermentans]
MLCRRFPFGYTKGDDGLPEIDAEKGAYVKKIFEMAMEGVSQNSIAEILKKEGIRSPLNKVNWPKGTVGSILENKKYIGDENFPAIVSKEMFEKVGQICNERKRYYNALNKYNNKSNAQYPFSGKIICGLCGSTFIRAGRNMKCTPKRYVWVCHRYVENGRVNCSSGKMDELTAETKFVEALWEVKKHFDKYVGNLENPFKLATNQTISQLDTKIQKLINQLESLPKDQSDSMIIEENIRKLLKQRTEEVWKIAGIDDFEHKNTKLKNELMKLKKKPQEFDGEIFRKVIDHVTFLSKDRIVFHFINGIEIEKDMK